MSFWTFSRVQDRRSRRRKVGLILGNSWTMGREDGERKRDTFFSSYIDHSSFAWDFLLCAPVVRMLTMIYDLLLGPDEQLASLRACEAESAKVMKN